ncbi:ketopantoate reductase family protein [Arsukibacterium sp.]|uniref:ketopantoate reductase family protein n=1 Tax=Arsukibacterium sp. TaxID=1977258 RepID=UPI002FDAE0DA
MNELVPLTIVGQGAIGLLAACQLQRQRLPVQLWLRHNESNLRQTGKLSVDFTDLSGQSTSHIYTSVNASVFTTAPATPLITRIVIPVKAYAVLPCLAELQPYLSSQAQLIISHNGMPELEAYQQQLKAEQALWFLSTTQAALRSASGVQHTGIGQSTLAAINPTARKQSASQQQALLQQLTLALGPVTLTADILPVLWQKLAINAVINPITALHRCRNGELAAPELAPLISALLREVCLVAAAEGMDLTYASNLSRVYQVIEATKANKSSMLQDIEHGRPTEINAITGYLLRCAARHKLTLPHNERLLAQVQQLAQGQS